MDTNQGARNMRRRDFDQYLTETKEPSPCLRPLVWLKEVEDV